MQRERDVKNFAAETSDLLGSRLYRYGTRWDDINQSAVVSGGQQCKGSVLGDSDENTVHGNALPALSRRKKVLTQKSEN